MKSNNKHVLLGLKICIMHFASLRKADQRGEKSRSIEFMDFSRNNLVVICERIKQITVCFAGEKKTISSSVVRREILRYCTLEI